MGFLLFTTVATLGQWHAARKAVAIAYGRARLLDELVDDVTEGGGGETPVDGESGEFTEMAAETMMLRRVEAAELKSAEFARMNELLTQRLADANGKAVHYEKLYKDAQDRIEANRVTVSTLKQEIFSLKQRIGELSSQVDAAAIVAMTPAAAPSEGGPPAR